MPLNPRIKQNRKTNSSKLYERFLAENKREYAVTLDETLFFIGDINGTRRICYFWDAKELEKYVFERKEKLTKSFLVVVALTMKGTLPLIQVPPNVKISSDYNIEKILKPLWEKEVPKLYPGECHKEFVHHDATLSHTSIKTRAYTDSLKTNIGIKFIGYKDIPIKSTDRSPMDFYAFGWLNQQLYKRKATTLK